MTAPPGRAAVAAAALGLLLAGCGTAADPRSGSRGDDRIDADRMAEVAADEDATVAEVVDAGSAVDAAASGDTVLVTYSVHNDDDEGRTAGAWRLYDADGGTIADEHAGVTEEGHATPRVLAVPDGYYVQDEGGRRWHVTPDGTRTRVRVAPRPSPARPGDQPLTDGSTRVYRPSDRTVVTISPRPTRSWQGWAVTSDGTSWSQGGGVEVGRQRTVPFRRSRDGGPWEDVAAFPLDGPRQFVAGLALTAVGGHVVVPVVTETEDLQGGRLDALLVRGVDDPAGTPWGEVDPGDLPGDGWWDVHVLAVDATTVALTTHGDPLYLYDVTDPAAAPTRVPPPTDEDGWTYEAEDGRLYATHGEHADAWVSDDLGARWARLPH